MKTSSKVYLKDFTIYKCTVKIVISLLQTKLYVQKKMKIEKDNLVDYLLDNS